MCNATAVANEIEVLLLTTSLRTMYNERKALIQHLL